MIHVRLADAGKRYVKYEDAPTLLSRAKQLRSRTRRSSLWAVRHVDLDVESGEAVGVIGRNGAGKSTLLRMLAGVTAPTEGLVAVDGRVAPLISVGVGFHPELTGRENVYVNGTVLGLSRAQVDQRFEQIVDFAEIGPFIDTPVKFYSSGMFVRLGFSVAVAAEPSVLLVDEVLAVGDFAFQMKCYERMRELQRDGTTMLVVSHNLNAIRNFCNRALVLHEGRPYFLGNPDEAISVLHPLLGGGPGEGPEKSDRRAPAELSEVELLNGRGVPSSHFEAGELVRVRMRARFRQSVEFAAFFVNLTSDDGVLVYADSNYLQNPPPFEAGQEATFEASFRATLTTGTYTLLGGVMWDHDQQARKSSAPVSFFVSRADLVSGVADLGARFEVSCRDRAESA